MQRLRSVSIRAANEKRQVSATGIARLRGPLGEGFARKGFSAFVEHDPHRCAGGSLQQARGLVGLARFGASRSAFAQFRNRQWAKTETAPGGVKALLIALAQLTLGILEPADGGNDKAHAPFSRRERGCRTSRTVPSRTALVGGRRLARPVRRPHLLEVIKLTDLVAEHVHDDVAGVEQDPVARLKPLDAYTTEAVVLQFASDLLGDRSDVPVRPAGGDHHEVTDGRLTC